MRDSLGWRRMRVVAADGQGARAAAGGRKHGTWEPHMTRVDVSCMLCSRFDCGRMPRAAMTWYVGMRRVAAVRRSSFCHPLPSFNDFCSSSNRTCAAHALGNVRYTHARRQGHSTCDNCVSKTLKQCEFRDAGLCRCTNGECRMLTDFLC